MGLISNLATMAYNTAVGITVGGLAINVLMNLLNVGGYLPSSVLSQVQSMTLFTFLFGLINNPFISIALSSATAIGIVSLVMSFSQTAQSFIQQSIFAVYVFAVFANADFFFTWVMTLADSSNLPIVTDVNYLIDTILAVWNVLAIIYYLMSIGIIPSQI